MVAIVSILVVVVLLFGAGAGIFLMIVINIHKVDRSKRLTDDPRTYLDAATRRVLGATGCMPAIRRREKD